MDKQAFKHPYDTPLAAGLRFLSELIAWVAGPWAASLVSGWLVVPTLVFLVALPGVFSTPGDKKQVVVATPGPIRVLIELFLYAVAAISPWLIWPTPYAMAAGFIVLASITFGIQRFVWLMRGARSVSPNDHVDPVALDPDNFEIRLENDRIRVLEVRIAPGDGHGMHWHPSHLVYTLSSYTVQDSLPDGSTKTLRRDAGELVWGKDLNHATKNIGDTEVHALIIEFLE